MKRNKRVFTERITLLLIAGLTLFGVQVTPTGAQASAAMGDQGPGGAYELVWNDEFNGTKLDRTKWTYYAGGWSDGVQNCYTWQDEKNVLVAGGSLRIMARHAPGAAKCKGQTRDFTSGFIQTRGGGPDGADNPRDKSPFKPSSFKYGYFEARMKMPKNKSTWPAFWMSPMNGKYGGWPASGEIDVMESKGGDYNYVAANLHYANDAGKRKQEQRITRTVDTTEWHTYAVKWEEDRFEFLLDGKTYHVVENIRSKYPKYTSGHPFDQPFYLRLNLAVGGKYINPSTTQTSPYSDPAMAIKTIPGFKETFPDTMEVDYVRVYQKTPQSEQQLATKKQELKQLIDRAANPQATDGMTQTTKQALNEELAKARAAYTNIATTAQGFTDRTTALQQALAALRADKQVLVDALTVYENQTDNIKADDLVQAAFLRAQAVYRADNPSTQEIATEARSLSEEIARAAEREQQREERERQEKAEQEKREREQAEREKQKQEEERKKQQESQNKGSASGFWEWFRRLFSF